MAGKITRKSKSIQKNIGGGQNRPTSMIRVKNLLFALTLLLTRDHNFVNEVLLWMLTASKSKSIHTKYLNVYPKLVTTSTFGYFFS